jgi:hypothetical protein
MTNAQVRPQIGIDEYTTTVSPLEMKFNNNLISTGTCFFWEAATDVYLVTNWHNVAGKNPLTGKHLSTTAAEPDSLAFDLWPNRQLSSRARASLVLNDHIGPCWLEHPVHGRNVDVVCLKLPSKVAQHVFPINTRSAQPLLTRVADEVFILGYPMGLAVDGLPIWKRASVASEPDIDIDGTPKIFVDTASSKGMSGSPVIRRVSGGGLTEDGNFTMYGGPTTRFIGVYSGRISTSNSLEAQLGIVWKARVIEEIVAASRRGGR